VASKFEIRSTKPETNSKSEIQKRWLRRGLFRVSDFDIRICFGFRASDFGFCRKQLRLKNQPPGRAPLFGGRFFCYAPA
jgi:hypothetical protein